MGMPGRKYQQGTSSYRYGQNGQERDKELNENTYSAEYWEYDSRIGRRWNIDPILKEYESPYVCFDNNPIWLLDPNGADTVKNISNAQLVDAIKVASNEVKNVIKNKEKYFSDAVKGRLLDAATNYWEEHQKEMNFAGFAEFKESVDQYYNGLATLAWWSGTSAFEKLDRAVINNKGVNNFRTAQITAGYIQETNANMWGIMGQAASTALFISSAGVGTNVGKGPVGTRINSATQQEIVNFGAGRIDNLLTAASKGSGNFSLGVGTSEQAMTAGKAWVGQGYRVASDGKTLISESGLRQFRPPSFKPKLKMTQANFESRSAAKGQWTSNGHLDIK